MSNLSANLQPLISIVIPTYNRWKFLQQAVASVIAQTYTNWELVIVDDGSTDGTKEGIESLHDKRIHVFSVPHCGNIAVLRNAGAAAGTGEWIAFLDSDDMWVPEKLELQLGSLQQQEKSWSYGGFEMMNEEGQTIPARSGKYIPLSGWIIEDLLTNKAAAVIGSLMIDRKLFEKTGGFNNAVRAREDYELVLRLAMEAEALAVPNLLVRIREHKGRRTNFFENGNERTASVYRHFVNTCLDKKLKRLAHRRLTHHLTEAAKKNIKQKKYRTATRQLVKALMGGDTLRHILSVFRS